MVVGGHKMPDRGCVRLPEGFGFSITITSPPSHGRMRKSAHVGEFRALEIKPLRQKEVLMELARLSDPPSLLTLSLPPSPPSPITQLDSPALIE